MSEPRKILAASVESQRRAAAYGLWDGETLVVTHLVALTAPTWRDDLRAECARRADAGFAVLVEDRAGDFSPRAASVSFDTVDEGGMTVFQRCVERTVSLEARGALVAPPEVARYVLRVGDGGLVDVGHDERGRAVLRPDWTRITGAHRALLLVVHGAVMEPPLSERWLSDFLSRSPRVPGPQGPGTPREIARAFSLGAQERFDAACAAREAGRHGHDA